MRSFRLLLIIAFFAACKKNEYRELNPSNFPADCEAGRLKTKTYNYTASTSAITTPEGFCIIDQNLRYLRFLDDSGRTIKSIEMPGPVTVLEKGPDGIFAVQSEPQKTLFKYDLSGNLLWSGQAVMGYVIKPLPDGGCVSYGRGGDTFYIYDASGSSIPILVEVFSSIIDIDYDTTEDQFSVLYEKDGETAISVIARSGLVKKKIDLAENNLLRVFRMDDGSHKVIQPADDFEIEIFRVDSTGNFHSEIKLSMNYALQRVLKTTEHDLIFLAESEVKWIPNHTAVFTELPAMDIHLIKLKENGHLFIDKKVGGASWDRPLAVEVDSTGFITVMGTSRGYDGTSRIPKERFYITVMDMYGNGCN